MTSHPQSEHVSVRRRRCLSIAIIAVWLILVVAVVVFAHPDRFDIEQILIQRFGPGPHGDAFDGVNRLAPVFLVTGFSWVGVCAGWLINSQRSALVVALIGPAMAIPLSFIGGNDLNDPNWHAILAHATIGCLAGIVTSVVYSIIQRSSRRPSGDSA